MVKKIAFIGKVKPKLKIKPIVLRVYKNKVNNQKLVTIPHDSDIEDGDFVFIEKAKVVKDD